MTSTATIQSDIQSPELDGRPVVSVGGKITSQTSGEVLALLQKAMHEGNRRVLIVDLSGVKHIDSSGLSALLEARLEAGKRNVRLVLSGLNKSPLRVLIRTGLNYRHGRGSFGHDGSLVALRRGYGQ